MTIERLIDEVKQDRICRMELLHESIQRALHSGSVDGEGDEADTEKKMCDTAALLLEEDVRLTGDADAVHNATVEYARKNYYDIACRILRKALGMKKYAHNVDLLADYLKYSGSSSEDDQEQADTYYAVLMKINKKKWNWRTYEFSIDYLLARLEWETDGFEAKMANILKLAEEYQEKYKNSEYADRACRELADVYMENGDAERRERILKEAVETLRKAPSCAMQLADSCYKRGLYREAAGYIRQCILANNELDSNINRGYPYILYALCLIQETYEKTDTDKGFVQRQLEEIEQYYDSAERCMESRDGQLAKLRTQIDLLKKWTKIDSADAKEYEE